MSCIFVEVRLSDEVAESIGYDLLQIHWRRARGGIVQCVHIRTHSKLKYACVFVKIRYNKFMRFVARDPSQVLAPNTKQWPPIPNPPCLHRLLPCIHLFVFISPQFIKIATKTVEHNSEVLMSDRDSFDIAVEGSPPVAVKLIAGFNKAMLLRLEPKDGQKKRRFLPFVWAWADDDKSLLWMALPTPLRHIFTIMNNLLKQILPSIGLGRILKRLDPNFKIQILIFMSGRTLFSNSKLMHTSIRSLTFCSLADSPTICL